MEKKTNVPILALKNGVVTQKDDVVVTENLLTITVDGIPFTRLICSPLQTTELAIGNLFAEGVIARYEDIASIEADGVAEVRVTLASDAKQNDAALARAPRVVTTGCGTPKSIAYDNMDHRNLEPLPFTGQVQWQDIITGMQAFQEAGALFSETGGAHACALSTGKDLLCFCEDIGRHNALDKTFGTALQRGIPFQDKMLFTTGRVPSDMVIKAVHTGIPIVVSRSAPTDKSIALAQQYHITLCGFVRQERMNVYACSQRINGFPSNIK
ncbi:MAG: formate dehydrogenase accessory sulfurtransferase FdhD [Eubacteriales bacterium]|nr:formate dehydrogenase accessory sulfurtransferase FdhD [Eubacteriales bacterium]